jgi:hypothetical protein
MAWIGIGVGLVIAGLSSFGLIQNRPASTVLVVIAIFLICHGAYEMWGKSRIFLERRIKGWLLKAKWSVEIEKKPEFYLIIWAKDDSNRELAITREKGNKGVLAFTAVVPREQDWGLKLAGLNATQQYQLMEDIKIFLASKDMGYDGVTWPLEKVTVQGGLLLDHNLSGYLVDLKAKSVINAVIGIRSIIRKAIAS